MMKWKRALGVALLLAGMAVLAGCGGQNGAEHGKTMLTVFAAASMTETMNEIAKAYQQEHPDVEIVYNFDSSGTLKHQIQNGAACDLFISAAQKQMDQLDASKDERANPEKLDFVLPGTRVDLLENKVVLATPEGNPKQITSFDDMAKKLNDGSIRLVMGNSDVPVGQYTQKILAHYGLDEQAVAEQGRITYGSNVKEVTTQVKEGSADCGVIYGTDAYSAGLKPVDEATKDMCGQVVYPAAVLKTSAHPEAAKEFLTYLRSEQALAVFESVGFSRAR